MKWIERKARLLRPSKTPEEREDRLLEPRLIGNSVKVCEDGMKKK